MTKAKTKDSLVWLEELVEAAKNWRVTLTSKDLAECFKARHEDIHNEHVVVLAEMIDGYRKAIKDEVEAEMKEEANG